MLPKTMTLRKMSTVSVDHFTYNGETIELDEPVDVVIRPEDIEIVSPEAGFMEGDIISVIFKGVHYEIEILANGYEWLVHTTQFYTVGTHVGINVIPFNIQIMNKPESEDEEAVEIDV